MQTQRSEPRGRSHGFTLIEVMTVVAIMGVVALVTVPAMLNYDKREDTRGAAKRFAAILEEARSVAQHQGVPTFLLFNSPAVPELEPGAFALMVIDRDANGRISTGDEFKSYHADPSINAEVTAYGMGAYAPYDTVAPPTEDAAMAPGSTMADLVDGTSFPLDPTTNRPSVGFSAKGYPVQLVNPMNWNDFGSGTGAFYFTDNERLAFAVIQLPLGGVRVRAFKAAKDAWE